MSGAREISGEAGGDEGSHVLKTGADSIGDRLEHTGWTVEDGGEEGAEIVGPSNESPVGGGLGVGGEGKVRADVGSDLRNLDQEGVSQRRLGISHKKKTPKIRLRHDRKRGDPDGKG